MAIIPTKKVKVQVRACMSLIFSAKLQYKVKAGQTLSWTFTFLVGIFAIIGELSHFLLLGETSSSKKKNCMLRERQGEKRGGKSME